MRQRRWIELFSDYECEIRYHPGKANVVANALSRKERVKPRRVRAMTMTIQSGVNEMILVAQSEEFKQENVLVERLHGLDQHMEKKKDGSLYFMDSIWVPLVGDARMVILNEAHKSRHSVHHGADKMYHDLRDMYCWPGMKRDERDLYFMDRIWVLLVGSVMDEAHASRYLTDQVSSFSSYTRRFQDVELARIYIDEWNSGDDQLRLRWMIYLVVLADVVESVRDAIGFEYCLTSSSGWTK
ncbi:putative reverse transcriptase domain-containing protein [Tanacetum coccineum]